VSEEPPLEPRYKIAPTQDVLVVPVVSQGPMINARAETGERNEISTWLSP
jgi:hypothetical protein